MGTGPSPKMPEQRRNKTSPQRGEWVDVVPRTDPVPDLPPGAWSEQAIRAWGRWWRDPAATQWTEADHDAVEVLLQLSDEFWGGKSQLANEMRLRADGLGLTQKGKRDLRLRVVEEEPEAPKAKPKAPRERLRVVI